MRAGAVSVVVCRLASAVNAVELVLLREHELIEVSHQLAGLNARLTQMSLIDLFTESFSTQMMQIKLL